MLLKGLLKRPLGGLEESVFDSGILGCDFELWCLNFLLDYMKAVKIGELLA